jgi:hypothetical protein
MLKAFLEELYNTHEVFNCCRKKVNLELDQLPAGSTLRNIN